MLLEDLYFQQLHRIELVEPWRLDNGTPGLLAGAVLLHFEDGVLACWSPLRYGMRPTGTALGVSVWSVPFPVDTNLRWIIATKEQCS